jgi:hypothetical protein
MVAIDNYTKRSQIEKRIRDLIEERWELVGYYEEDLTIHQVERVDAIDVEVELLEEILETL